MTEQFARDSVERVRAIIAEMRNYMQAWKRDDREIVRGLHLQAVDDFATNLEFAITPPTAAKEGT